MLVMFVPNMHPKTGKNQSTMDPTRSNLSVDFSTFLNEHLLTNEFWEPPNIEFPFVFAADRRLRPLSSGASWRGKAESGGGGFVPRSRAASPFSQGPVLKQQTVYREKGTV